MESWYVSMVLNRCPACAEGELFQSWFKLNIVCPHCGARFERWPGSWTGPTVGGYSVGAGTGVLLAWVLYLNDALVPGVEWAIAAAACVAVLLAFRFVKGAWVGMMYDWGYIYPDPVPSNPEVPPAT